MENVSLTDLNPAHEEIISFYVFFKHMNTKNDANRFRKKLKQKFKNLPDRDLQQLKKKFSNFSRTLDLIDFKSSEYARQSEKSEDSQQRHSASSSADSDSDDQTEITESPKKSPKREKPEPTVEASSEESDQTTPNSSENESESGSSPEQEDSPGQASHEKSATKTTQNKPNESNHPKQPVEIPRKAAPKPQVRDLFSTMSRAKSLFPKSCSRCDASRSKDPVARRRNLFGNAQSRESRPRPEVMVSAHPKGIQNIGNSCYSSCILQILYYQPRFLKKIAKFRLNEEKRVKYQQKLSLSDLPPLKQRKYKTALNGARFVRSLQRFFKKMTVAKSEWVSPSDVFAKMVTTDNARIFQVGVQEDVVEFLARAFRLIEAGFRMDEQVALTAAFRGQKHQF